MCIEFQHEWLVMANLLTYFIAVVITGVAWKMIRN